MRMRTEASIVLAACLMLAAAGCTKDQREQLTEAAARNAAAVAGTNAFEAAGHALESQLSCDAQVSQGTGDRIQVSCSGTTKDGEPVALTGEASNTEGDGVRGSFTGTLDGKEVFSQDCLGC